MGKSIQTALFSFVFFEHGVWVGQYMRDDTRCWQNGWICGFDIQHYYRGLFPHIPYSNQGHTT